MNRPPPLPLVALLLLAPASASADRARLQALGGVDLYAEDSANIFTNPGLIGQHTDRAWFSLGVSSLYSTVFDPLGGAAIRLGPAVDLGVVLNRSPQSYGFDDAMWPIATLYMPSGPGGILQIPGAPTAATAPLRFPIDLFLGFGRREAPVHVGVNLYYAGGTRRSSSAVSPEGAVEETEVLSTQQSHLIHLAIGVATRTTDLVRPEVWVRGGNLFVNARDDAVVGQSELLEGETVTDRVMALSSDVRVGGGVRVHVGDADAALIVSPTIKYDMALGWYHYNDEFESSDAERLNHAPTAHNLQAGVGIRAQVAEVTLIGSAGVTIEELRVKRTHAREGTQTRERRTDVALPEVSLGAEGRILPPLVLRAGLRTALVGGRTTQSTTFFEEDVDGLVDVRQIGASSPRVPILSLEASGGVGLQVRRMTLDATLGGLILGQDGAALIGRLDLSFAFR